MPSPEDLKGKILIKNKKLPPGKDDTFEDEYDSESEEDGNEQETKTKENDKRKKLSTVKYYNILFFMLCKYVGFSKKL